MFYDPLAPCRDARDGCETPPTDEDNGNQNGGNGNNEPSTPDLTPPVSPTPPDDDQDENGQNGTLPVDAIDPRLLALAMGFVPYQSWETALCDRCRPLPRHHLSWSRQTLPRRTPRLRFAVA